MEEGERVPLGLYRVSLYSGSSHSLTHSLTQQHLLVEIEIASKASNTRPMLSDTPDWVADPVPGYWIADGGPVGWAFLFQSFHRASSLILPLPSRTLFATQTHTHTYYTLQ